MSDFFDLLELIRIEAEENCGVSFQYLKREKFTVIHSLNRRTLSKKGSGFLVVEAILRCADLTKNDIALWCSVPKLVRMYEEKGFIIVSKRSDYQLHYYHKGSPVYDLPRESITSGGVYAEWLVDPLQLHHREQQGTVRPDV